MKIFHFYPLFNLFLGAILCTNIATDLNDGGAMQLDTVKYRAAVVEYEPYNNWTRDGKGEDILLHNAKMLAEYAHLAKSAGADIIITPEYGLQGNVMSDHRDFEEDFLSFTQYVPDPCLEIRPYALKAKASPRLKILAYMSFKAREIGIYMVIDMPELYPCLNETIQDVPWDLTPSDDCPQEGYFVYNTQVVFDRQGTVVARYRKINLYLESGFTAGPRDDASAIFKTDFNVTFSLQICFDIMYQEPAYNNIKKYGIKDAILSTKWEDQLPFELGDVIPNGWSRGLGVNLLASGYHDPEHYSMGSGIYGNYMNNEPFYVFNKNSGNVLVVGPVTTTPVNVPDQCNVTLNAPNSSERSFTPDLSKVVHSMPTEKDRFHAILHQDLSSFSRVMLEKSEQGKVLNATVCNEDQFCCDLSYEYSGNLIYYFIAFSGLEPVGLDTYFLGVQQCGVVWCETSDFVTCAFVELGLPNQDYFGPFQISSSSFQSDFVFPVGNTRDLYLINDANLEFEKEGNTYSLTARKPVSSLLTAALYGRWYSRDS